jgi:hypothetical protein
MVTVRKTKAPVPVTDFENTIALKSKESFCVKYRLFLTMTQHDATEDTRDLYNCQLNL